MSVLARRVAVVVVAVMTMSLVLTAPSTAARPTTPGGVTATSTASSVTVTWNAVPGAQSYAVCLRTTTDTDAPCVKWSPRSSARSASFTGLKPTGGVDYVVQVSAYNADGASYSARVPIDLLAAPDAPTGITTTTTPTSMTLSWPASARAKTYAVCLREEAGDACQWSSNSGSRTATFTGLEPRSGDDYIVQVNAYNDAGAAYGPRFPVELIGVPDAPKDIEPAVTASRITLTWPAAARADTYAVCLRDEVDGACRWSERSSSPTATFSGLRAQAGDDYIVQVSAYNDAGAAYAPRMPVELSLDPDAPSGISTSTTPSSITVRWDAAAAATSYAVCLRDTLDGPCLKWAPQSASRTAVFTGLEPQAGTDYYVQVNSYNVPHQPAYSARIPVALKAPQPFRAVMASYNLCGQNHCLPGNGSTRMLQWPSRKAHAGALARSANVDVLATQESGDVSNTNFITELRPAGFERVAYWSAKSLFVKTTKYDVLASSDEGSANTVGGPINMENRSGKTDRWAVWAILRDKVSGGRVVVIDAHLVSGKGRTGDNDRRYQTQRMISEVRKINPDNLPVVYAGDYNSNESNANQRKYPGGFDAPRSVFRDTGGHHDTYDIADRRVDETWNSANQGINPPLRFGDHVDKLYVSPGVTTLSWRVWARKTSNLKSYANPFPSDHNIVRAELMITGK